jgi:hypothetical protein
MNINRHNYEEFFLLYVDNELNIAQRKAVEAFIAQNPDLRAELEMLQEAVLPADEGVVFSGKESLLRTASAPNPVNETNCEEYFVLYADDELNNEEKDLVEQFVYRNPQHEAAFELMQQVKLMPDTSIVFPDKYALYRHEEDDRKPVPVIRMRFWKIALAAAVLLFVGGMGWYMSTDKGGNGTVEPTDLANNGTKATQRDTVQQPKEQMPVVTPQQQNQSDNQTFADNNTEEQQKQQQAAQKQRGVKASAPKDDAMAVKKDDQEKNITDPSNIQPRPDVKPTEAYADNNGKTEKIKEAVQLKASTNVSETIDHGVVGNIPTPEKGSDLAVNTQTVKTTFGPDSDPELDPNTVASTDNKKNKMRGFFRRVSRVFEKTASLNSDGDERKGIRIASFEIALK